MEISSMGHFQNICRQKFVNKYRDLYGEYLIITDTFVVWCCKTLQNYKCIVSANNCSHRVLAEYTYNGNKQELYEDFYEKKVNTCYTEIGGNTNEVHEVK